MLEAINIASAKAQDDRDLPFPKGTPYKGIVPAKGFLTGTQLASMIGLTDGTAVNDDAGWLHYIEDSGLELYIAKKPLRINTTWELINTAQGGNKKVVEVNGERYVVRFIAGNAGAYDYAWDRYILGVYNSADRSGFPTGVPYWGDYTASMLGVAVTNELADGSHTICAEPDTSRGGYVCRGNGGSSAVRGVTANWYLPANTRYKHYGWRPMLVKESTIPAIPFKGEVDQKDFITDTDLAAQLGVTGGTRINAGVQWLHFVFDKGPELYIAKKSMRSNLTWEFYNNLGLALGKRLIQVGDRYFKVRFILGADKEPANATLGREWIQLFPPLTNGAWANYLYSDLGVGTGTSNGELAMFQEISMRSDKAHAAGPYSGTSNLWYQPAGATNGGYGWRPVLELVKDLPVYPDSGPGPKVLMSGTEDLGYFGQVTATELFGAKDFLARAYIPGTTLVASANTQVYTWLKFFFKKKVLYIAKVPFASGLTWENAYKAGMVYGERGTGLFPVAGAATEQYRPMIKDDNGKVHAFIPRLIRGLAADNYASKDDDQYAGSEWTELLGRTVIEANRPITEKWDNLFMVDIGSGGTEYTLGLETNRSNNNAAVYMTDPNSVVNRFTHRDSVSKTQNNLYYRPVLELAKREDAFSGDKYLGEVSSVDFIDGAGLASLVNLTAGTAFNNDAGWLKFQSQEGKTLFVAKRPLRYQLSWNQLYNANLILGNTIIEYKGSRYKVRLMRGAEATTSGWVVGEGQDDPIRMDTSEWNRFIYRVHVDNPGRSPSWANFSNTDLGLGAGVTNGRLTLCQEDIASQASQVTGRANTDLKNFNYVYKTNGGTSTYSHYGWRPVLELV